MFAYDRLYDLDFFKSKLSFCNYDFHFLDAT